MDADLFEFRILCMHNFENDHRLQKSGKISSRTGFLQPIFVDAPEVYDDTKDAKRAKKLDDVS